MIWWYKTKIQCIRPRAMANCPGAGYNHPVAEGIRPDAFTHQDALPYNDDEHLQLGSTSGSSVGTCADASLHQ